MGRNNSVSTFGQARQQTRVHPIVLARAAANQLHLPRIGYYDLKPRLVNNRLNHGEWVPTSMATRGTGAFGIDRDGVVVQQVVDQRPFNSWSIAALRKALGLA